MKTGSAKLGRRDFLRALGARRGSGGGKRFAGDERAGRQREQRGKRKARYRETEHVKTYYRVNRYPTKR